MNMKPIVIEGITMKPFMMFGSYFGVDTDGTLCYAPMLESGKAEVESFGFVEVMREKEIPVLKKYLGDFKMDLISVEK